MRRNGSKNRVQRPDAQGSVGRNSHAMMPGLLSLQDDMAAHLVHALIVPMLAQVADEFFTTLIARQLHATASTSSRTMRRRIEAGGRESK